MSKDYLTPISIELRSYFSKNELPDSGLGDLFRYYALLVLVKGIDVTDKDVHDSWSLWAIEHDPNNESLVPYEELDERVRNEDAKFTEAIRTVAMKHQ